MLMYAAAHYGIQGVGCSISSEQVALARQRVKERGLDGKVEILQEDYRNIPGPFDKFVSIGMFEHVGKRFIPLFIEKTKSLLKPGGAGLLHTVGKERDTPEDMWTMRHIFPGAYIPVLGNVIGTMGEKGLVPLDIENMRLHYSLTLDAWAERFESHASEIEEKFGERFVRMWRMYLNGSAACFRDGDIRLFQILFTNGVDNSFPLTRDHVYA
jgi:cyclopropane-fatty-acyl-phospholipid synthase